MKAKHRPASIGYRGQHERPNHRTTAGVQAALGGLAAVTLAISLLGAKHEAPSAPAPAAPADSSNPSTAKEIIRAIHEGSHTRTAPTPHNTDALHEAAAKTFTDCHVTDIHSGDHLSRAKGRGEPYSKVSLELSFTPEYTTPTYTGVTFGKPRLIARQVQADTTDEGRPSYRFVSNPLLARTQGPANAWGQFSGEVFVPRSAQKDTDYPLFATYAELPVRVTSDGRQIDTSLLYSCGVFQEQWRGSDPLGEAVFMGKPPGIPSTPFTEAVLNGS
jgi:hypothetical protein